MTDPHEAKMKEFYVGVFFDNDIWPTNCKTKKTVHLCDKCYRGLSEIAVRRDNKDAV